MMGSQWNRLGCFIVPVPRRRFSCLLSALPQLRLIFSSRTNMTKRFYATTRRVEERRAQQLKHVSDGELEDTFDVIEESKYYRSSADDVAKMGFDKPNLRKAKFTALCQAFSSNQDIVAIKRRIPPSDTVHLVNKVHLMGIKDIEEDYPILNSELYQEEACFINTCGQNLEFNSFHGGFVPTKGIIKKAAFKIDGTTGVEQRRHASYTRDYGVIRSAILDGWGNCSGRNALQVMFFRIFGMCDEYRQWNSLSACEEPLKVCNIGAGSRRWPGIYKCNFAVLDEDSVDLVAEMTTTETLKYYQDMWDTFEEIASKTFTPDVQVYRSFSSENPFGIETVLTAEIKCVHHISQTVVRQTWNKALVGLHHSNHTYALIMALHSALLMKIEIQDDGTILTYEKMYTFQKAGSKEYLSDALEELFSDLVKIIWKKTIELA